MGNARIDTPVEYDGEEDFAYIGNAEGGRRKGRKLATSQDETMVRY